MYLFPDTTVLCNFAAIDEMRLVHEFVGTRGRWVQSIQAEVRKSAMHHRALGVVEDECWFGEPIALDRDDEPDRVDRFRRIHLFGDPSRPLQHLGESETFVAVATRQDLAGSTFLTDDHDAHHVFTHFGVRVTDTLDVLNALAGWSSISPETAHECCSRMVDAGRNLRRASSSPRDFI